MAPRKKSAATDPKAATPATITRSHPMYHRYVEDEARCRASYLATRRLLSPFLVPHRFEGDVNMKPTDLRRARFGYGIGLNSAYLQELFGHLRGAPATYRWGPLAGKGDDPEGVSEPTGGLAKTLWEDATNDGRGWRNFFLGDVLEWMLSGLGGYVIVDIPSVEARTRAEEAALGKRPYLRFVPISQVADFANDGSWVKIKEVVDQRDPFSGEIVDHIVLYQLVDGRTMVTRYDGRSGQVVPTSKGEQSADLGELIDIQGRPILPVIPARYGAHPEIPHVGAGLLLNLADIVVDLYNRMSELSEGYRDSVFGLTVHKGPDPDNVRTALAEGSRLVALGNNPEASLERIAAEAGEVEAGLKILEVGLTAWALSAKRKAADAVTATTARSGVSLAAEFQLDLKPLLVSLVETVTELEQNCMFVAAQLAGVTVQDADDLGVSRSTEFRLEDESSRISRIVGDYVKSLPMPDEAKVRIGLRWMESSGLLNLDEEVQGEDGTPATLRDVLEAEMRDDAATEKQATKRMAAMVPPSGADPGDPGADPEDPNPSQA